MTQYDTEIRDLEVKQRAVSDRLVQLEQLRAEELCPFKVGQILINRKGAKARVSHITTGYGDSYRLKGRLIRKDGSDGIMARDLWDWDDWKAID